MTGVLLFWFIHKIKVICLILKISWNEVTFLLLFKYQPNHTYNSALTSNGCKCVFSKVCPRSYLVFRIVCMSLKTYLAFTCFVVRTLCASQFPVSPHFVVGFTRGRGFSSLRNEEYMLVLIAHSQIVLIAHTHPYNLEIFVAFKSFFTCGKIHRGSGIFLLFWGKNKLSVWIHYFLLRKNLLGVKLFLEHHLAENLLYRKEVVILRITICVTLLKSGSLSHEKEKRKAKYSIIFISTLTC